MDGSLASRVVSGTLHSETPRCPRARCDLAWGLSCQGPGPSPCETISMTQLRTIYQTCRPRADVEAGTTKDEQFAADLAQVVNKTAPKEYADPAVFFKHSYP